MDGELSKDSKSKCLQNDEVAMDESEDFSDSYIPDTSVSISAADSSKFSHFALTWNDLSYSVKVKRGPWWKKKEVTKTLLSDLNGSLNSGEMVAVMGTSGAGKTTFMNLMAGRTNIGKVDGSILLDGKRRGKSFRSQCAYVEQDDVFLANLTVKETFYFNSFLRLPKNLSTEVKKARADEVIAQLGLSSCQSTRIGSNLVRGISGGERKRCSIGIELLTNPKILFLDEPTSGLDAFTSYHVMKTVKGLAREHGRAVMCTIHQPRSNIFDLFDKLLLLSKGKTVYYGPASEAMNFFKSLGYTASYSPADFFLDLTTVDTRTPYLENKTRKRNEKLISAYNNSSYKVQALSELQKPRNTDSNMEIKNKDFSEGPKVGWWGEFSTLYKRATLNIIRERRTTAATYAQALVTALLTGIVFYKLTYTKKDIQNRNGVLFFMCLNQTFQPMLAKVLLFHLERPLFIRERHSKLYSVSSYYTSKTLAEFPIVVWSTVILGTIIYWMAKLNPSADRYFFFVLVLIANFFSAESLGLVISSATPSVEVGNTIAPVCVILFMLFSGFYVHISSIPRWISWIGYVSFIAYSYQALAKNEFMGEEFACNSSGSCISGEEELKEKQFEGSKYLDVFYIFLIGFFLRVIGYLSLYFITKPKKKLY